MLIRGKEGIRRVEHYRVKALIDLDAIYGNIERTKKKLSSDTKLLAVIKANAYGHGAVAVSKILEPLADMYGVALVEEGIELRESGCVKPILILGTVPMEQYKEALAYHITPTLYTYDMALEYQKEAKKHNCTGKAHIKLDTGMGRIGFLPNEKSLDDIEKICKLSNIEIEGCFTHMARADEKDRAATEKQFEIYNWFISELEKRGITFKIHHLANSASIMGYSELYMDMVRSGISTYGIYPSDEVDKSKLLLKPAMSIQARISYIKTLPKGYPVSYGGTYVTTDNVKAATIPVGYADGYPRALSGKADVLVHGRRVPVIGRVCMDQFMVDITNVENVSVGDWVTLMGKEGDEEITVEELSYMAGSFPYEFVCGVSARVPREYYFRNVLYSPE